MSNRKIKYYRLIWLKHDLPAGLSVFLVALPLCLGIALASNAPIYAGLVSGIIGGLVVALISGSPLAVSGPAAGLTTLVAVTILSLGDYRLFLLSVIIAGLFQVLLGVFKLGAVANYFPSSVIKGMLAAIGILLISKQIPIALGYDQPDFWASGFLGLFSSDELRSNINNFYSHFTTGAVIITLVSMGLLSLLQQPFAKKLKVLPAPLFVVVVGIIIYLLFKNTTTGDLALHKNQLVNIPANIFESIMMPDLTKFFSNGLIWKQGIVIGLLASLETLLCIEAIDKLDKHNRVTPVNRELIAQGIGNMACGLLGAIPMTAVVVRGSANVDAGARTKFAAFTHGLFLLLAVLLIPFALNLIPYASLAAILIITGYNLAKPKLFIHMWRLGLKQFLPFMFTIIIILATDLLIGVCIGLLISIFFIIQNNFRLEYNIQKQVKHDIEYYYIKLHLNVTFLNKIKLRDALERVPKYSVLTIDGTNSRFVDHDILEIISEFENKARDRHIEVHLKGIERVNVIAGH